MWSVAGRGSRQTSAPKHRERHVFLNLDATAASLTMCRLLFAPLQTPSAGTTCVSTSRRSPTTCAAPERQPSHAPSDHVQQDEPAHFTGSGEVRAQLLTQLQKGAAAANAKKLVLAMGGGALDTSNSSAYQEIVSKFLVEGWHVEIHAWLRALDDGRAVVKSLDEVLHDSAFLKKKVKRAAAQHVCTTLSCGDAPLKVVALPVAALDAAQRAMEACGEDGAVKILSKAVPGGNDRKRQDQAEDGGAANAMNAAHSKAAWGVDMSGNAFLKEQDQHQHSLHTSSWEELNAGDLIGNEAAIAKWGLKTWNADGQVANMYGIQRYVIGDVNNGGFDPVDGNGGTNAEFAGAVVAGGVDCVRNGGEVNAADRRRVKQVSPDELSDTGLAARGVCIAALIHEASGGRRCWDQVPLRRPLPPRRTCLVLGPGCHDGLYLQRIFGYHYGSVSDCDHHGRMRAVQRPCPEGRALRAQDRQASEILAHFQESWGKTPLEYGPILAGFSLAGRTKQAKPKTTMVTETYFRKALAQSKNRHSLLEKKHSLLEKKHALLENEHSQVKTAHSKLQEEHAELLNERNDLEGDTWLWMMQNNKLQAQHKELQAEHSKWKAACASLVKEVERKVLEEEYLAYLAQEYDQTHWPVAKVAELEGEQERKLAEAHKSAKEREQALMDKIAALESEVASLQSTIQQKDDDFDSFRQSSKEATDKVVKDLAEAKAETMKHEEVIRTLRAALENGAKTAPATTNLIKQRRFAKSVEVPARIQQRKTPVKLQEQRLREKSSSSGSPSTVNTRSAAKMTATAATLKKAAVKPVEMPAHTLQDRMRRFELERKQKVKSLQERQRLREKSSSYNSPSTVSRPTTTSSKASTKTTASPVTLRGVAKVPAQTLQRPGRKQELTKPKEIRSVPSKATSRWEQYKNQRSGPSSAATSSTSSSPEMSPRSAA
uniref:Uncharacterized protein n=1 Tax=Phytophthora ramorum TaxID=164328 RepID=H3GTQ8_PHYRM